MGSNDERLITLLRKSNYFATVLGVLPRYPRKNISKNIDLSVTAMAWCDVNERPCPSYTASSFLVLGASRFRSTEKEMGTRIGVILSFPVFAQAFHVKGTRHQF